MGKIRIKQIDLSQDNRPVAAGLVPAHKKGQKTKKTAKKLTKLKGKGGGRIVSMDLSDQIDSTKGAKAKTAAPVKTLKIQASKKAKKSRSRRYKLTLMDIDQNKVYSPKQAVGLVKKASYSRFNGSVELHLNLIDTNIPSSLVLPHPIKRRLRILVFTDDDKLAGRLVSKYGDIITSGGADLIDQIKNARVSINKYNYALATPNIVPKLPGIARLLGPKGLMPNPKNKTITNNPAQKIDQLLKGSLNLKPEPKHPLLHLVIGKVNDEEKNLLENLRAVLKTIGVGKIKKAVLAPTMGPGIKINLKF